ncbi:MAM and LDL-receptor class A domain-containing protein 1-like [Lingula anatina]|uniref:MAM and LDL-receptor class A domain-containing protein 1-like n=1 Tax=Lingula anatina TaxID=7574 RepID=A0A1S3H8K0_LINAN|nr:MAM and LDL-receptor class A domain-containing protein 1-like [Lingula anatina]|eukprot:XP_013382327.1 MAM and LDL-receptor class A domain-containing protein 1-like [Lingula anatina]
MGVTTVSTYFRNGCKDLVIKSLPDVAKAKHLACKLLEKMANECVSLYGANVSDWRIETGCTLTTPPLTTPKTATPTLISNTIKALSTAKPSVPQSPRLPPPCDFDSGAQLCGWSQDERESQKWILNSGPTPSILTGPYGDASSNGSGRYIYAAASWFLHRARLLSPEITIHRPSFFCLSFHYHMYNWNLPVSPIGGSAGVNGNGVLIVGRLSSGKYTPLGAVKGNRNEWLRAQFSLDFLFSPMTFRFYIETTTGVLYPYNVAVDNLEVREGACKWK